MATVAGDLTSIALLIAEIPNYSGQILPDEWYQRINQILTLPSITVAAFDNPLRADILKSKMARKYTNIPAQHAGNNIDNPARFIVWLRHKYQTETVGIQQVATQRLAQEKFLPFDNPETYEARIHPLLLGVADGDANILGLLKGHLSGELYTWMKIANPAGINSFFTELKNMWLERPLNLYRGSISDQISQAPPITSQSTITSKEMTKPKTNTQAPSLPPKPQIKKNITSNTNDVDEITKDSDSDTSTNESESNYNSSSESSPSESESEAEINVKDAEAPPLASVPISKKEKQTPSQDEQSRLEKNIEKIIEKMLNEKFGTITTPLHPQNSNSKTLADSEDDEFIDDPMEIDFVQRKEPATDVVTTKCKIKKHDLRHIATTPTESLGIVRNVLVNFAPGYTIYADFAVVKYPKPMLILPNTLLDKYNYDLLASKRELRLECNAIRSYEMSSEEFWQKPSVEISGNEGVLDELDNSLVIDSNDFKDPTIG
ncbi:hypothetical protein C2G38_2160545 [Gigaspora rosea]|uniref:Uncharacterized protein n=1 Tax=Gigaspora rosea TaxID=44941 RepID=A0A397VY62_9GLOM|nr:hypothetical protein C2G38_2160545 [Gigaspora rosea]